MEYNVEKYGEKKVFSEQCQQFMKEKLGGKDIYSLSLEELKTYKEDLEHLIEENSMLELCSKLLNNAAYGACANRFFYYYDMRVASDITAEARNLTKFMWNRLEEFFHEDIWQRKDLWEKFGFELDESKHDWFREQHISEYSDTDSVYTQYGDFFRCWTPETLASIPERDDKIKWILRFNKEFLDKQNTEWMNDMYNPRHCHSIHEFELETVSEATITLKKKKYLKAMSYSKGKWFTPSKITGVGIELIKTTSPKLAKEIITDMTRSLVYDTGKMSKEEYILYFNSRLDKWKKKFWAAPIEDISQSINVGNYKKYVLCDEEDLMFAKQTPVSVKCAARYNYLAKKNNQRNLRIVQGQKVKYYNIRLGNTKKAETDYFGYPSGELPSWAPPCDKPIQWQKNVLDPLNRFLEVMKFPLLNNNGTVQFDLFGNA